MVHFIAKGTAVVRVPKEALYRLFASYPREAFDALGEGTGQAYVEVGVLGPGDLIDEFHLHTHEMEPPPCQQVNIVAAEPLVLEASQYKNRAGNKDYATASKTNV